MKKNSTLIIVLLLFSVGIFFNVYYPAIHGKYFADDFGFIFIPYENNLSHVFLDKNETSYAYRPLEKLFLLTIQNNYGYDTTAIHITQMTLHFLFSVMFFMWLRKEGFSIGTSVLVFLYLLFSQAATHAVASNDTFSQIISTLFGYFSIFFYLQFIKSKTRSAYLYIYSLLFFAVSLLGKENALSFFPLLVLIAINNFFKLTSICKQKLLRVFFQLVPFFVTTLFYFAIRKYLDLDAATFGEDRFNMNFGLNIPINFIQAFVLALIPFSSVDLYQSIQNKSFLFLVIGGLYICIYTIILFVPLFNKEQRLRLVKGAILLPVSLFPVIILNHISELYVYNMLPIMAFLLAISIETIINRNRQALSVLIVMFFLTGFLINSFAIRSKVNSMKINGDMTHQMLQEIKPYLKENPFIDTLVLINKPYDQKNEYSIFKRSGFRLFEDGEVVFNKISERNDLEVKIVKMNEFTCKKSSDNLYLAFDENYHIRKYQCK